MRHKKLLLNDLLRSSRIASRAIFWASVGSPASPKGYRAFFVADQLLCSCVDYLLGLGLFGRVGVKLKPVSRTTASNSFSLSRAAILLVGVFVIAFPAFAYYGQQAHGSSGILAAAVAAVVCLAAGLLALIFFALFRDPRQVFNGVGLAMLFRMAIPMAIGVVLTNLGGPLAEAGVFGMIVGFYLVGLLVETLLAVRLVSSVREEQVSKAA